MRRGGNLTVIRTDEGDPTRGTNEKQRIMLPTQPDGSPFITGGTFTLTYTTGSGTETTAPIRYNAAATEVEQALADLPSIEPTDVRAVGRSGGPWIVEFKGNLALTPQPELTGDGSGLTGGVVPTIVQVNAQPRVQTIALPAPKGGNTSLGGHFTLSYNNGAVNDTTAAIPWNATAAAVQTALGNLASIGSGNVAVTGPTGGPWSVSLTGLPGLAGQPLIVANAGGLTGGISLDIQESTAGSGVNEVQRISRGWPSGAPSA